jgi:parallel beta-helix repeat protein
MKRFRVLPILLLLLFSSCSDRVSTPTLPEQPKAAGVETIAGHVVTLPAGSVDALAAAIAAAGKNGKVIVEAGMHFESAQVVISSKVSIEGEPGAILEVATTPDPNGISSEAALFIRDTKHVRVSGLEIRSAGGAGNAGIMLFRAHHVSLSGNTISDQVFGIGVVLSDHAVISDNTVSSSGAHGILLVSGSHAKVEHNTVNGAGFFGIWYCGAKGRSTGNVTTNCFVGAILCKVPAGSLEVDGVLYGSDVAGRDWVVRDNVSSDNLTTGHLVIDDANNNLLINNTGSNNGTYDIELSGDSYRFGFLTPRSFANQVVIGPGNESLTVKDCGDNNSIIGTANIIDLTMDPCY